MIYGTTSYILLVQDSPNVTWKITLRQVIRDLADENQNIVEVVLVLHRSRIAEELNIQGVLEKIKNFGWRGLL